MRLLGIDYGDKKVGLAHADGPLAEPMRVIRYKNEFELFEKLTNLITEQEIEKVIIGVATGKVSVRQKEFATKLAREIDMPIELQDEAFSTKEANEKLFAGKKNWRKRKAMEDAYSAAIILQRYIDA